VNQRKKAWTFICSLPMNFPKVYIEIRIYFSKAKLYNHINFVETLKESCTTCKEEMQENKEMGFL